MCILICMSPSSRRAWIEIAKQSHTTYTMIVALLAEGVDRNLAEWASPMLGRVALLAEGVDRNVIDLRHVGQFVVALLAEGVDRNRVFSVTTLLALPCRPPRGGRG